MEYSISDYRNGGEGFCLWVEQNVCLPIYPPGQVIPKWVKVSELPRKQDQYGRSYRTMWENQKHILLDALQMQDGRFKHRLIVFCWPRGEGKSMIACLIQLWKFFNWPRQQIMLGANSKDQVKFVHYDIMRDIVYNSPNLFRRVGGRNIQEKEIRLRDDKQNVSSKIRSISSFTGIVSNITGYTFSEMFDMKNPDFFVQLDGSIRGIPNAMGVIDSTVSSKQHVLYQLYLNQEKTETLCFSYRHSKTGSPEDYWNPNMTKQQLDDYRIKFPFGEYERYFLNLWSAGSERVFTPEMIEATHYIGVDGKINVHKELMVALDKRTQITESTRNVSRLASKEVDIRLDLWEVEKRLMPVQNYYQLKTEFGLARMATVEDLERMGDVYDTDWAVTGGIDRADPMKRRSAARTIITFVGKGLPGSRTHPYSYDEDASVPQYIYILLHIISVTDHSLESMKEIISLCHTEYKGIDMITGERWGIWDLAAWCEENGIPFEAIYPTYDRQKGAFAELYMAYGTGRIKMPPLGVTGSKMDDILEEEAMVFDHDSDKRWFGSPQKEEKYGVQDDAMYALGWNLYGGRLLTIDSFRPRVRAQSFGMFVEPQGKVVGMI